MRRADLVAELKKENEGWERLLADIGEDRMEEPGVAGAWSVKDVVAHLAAWRRRTVGRLEAAARGEPEPKAEWPADLTDDDAINAWFHSRDKGRTLSDVMSESRKIFARLVAAIEKLPEKMLDDPEGLPWMGGTPLTGAALFSHFHDEHEKDLRAFAAGRPARS